MSNAMTEAGGSRIVPFTETPPQCEAPGIASRTVRVNGVRRPLVEYDSVCCDRPRRLSRRPVARSKY